MTIQTGTPGRKPQTRTRFSARMAGMAMLFALASAVPVSRASAADDAGTCTRANGAEAIAACTRVIQNSGASGQDRGLASVKRGATHRAEGNFDSAIADSDGASRLDPGDISAYDGRGAAYTPKRDFDRSLADLNKAIRLDRD
jgi:Flp pilus assembly protein TadD